MITRVSMDKITGAVVVENGIRYQATYNSRVRDSVDILVRLQGAKRFPPQTKLSYYKDSDGNEYLIAGEIPKQLPDPVAERLAEKGRK